MGEVGSCLKKTEINDIVEQVLSRRFYKKETSILVVIIFIHAIFNYPTNLREGFRTKLSKNLLIK